MNATPTPTAAGNLLRSLAYLGLGTVFGILLLKGQVADWYRIQEMFRLQSFHLYGIIGSAILVAMAGIWALRRCRACCSDGSPIRIGEKQFNRGQIYGGLLFGLGWGATGACPGPLYAQIGAGYGIVAVTLLSALAGTLAYGLLQKKLPH
ncbi:DUF6691 family protein [Thermomonas flagellata]|uniref:DUF6691 family protein n=1 Tax=Thermomonas flagellata TaxID=2888524 RepID=UPI001F034F3E|nr:DUF6691 family protein [Thermomonas flagellata]